MAEIKHNAPPAGMQRGLMGPPRHGRGAPGEKPKNLGGTLKKLVKYIGRSKYLLMLLIVVMLFGTAMNLIAPSLQGEAINTITLTDGKLNIDRPALISGLVKLGIVYGLYFLFTFLQSIIGAKISQVTVYTMRRDLFRKISHLSIRYTDTHRHGDLMSRMTNDVDNISNTISNSIATLISSILTLFGSIIIIISYSWKMALVTLITVPLTMGVSALLSKLMSKYFVRRQQLLGQLNGEIEEMVTGYKTVMAYGKEADAMAKFANISDKLSKCGVKADVWGGIMGPCNNLINNLNYLIVVAFGAYFAIKGTIRVGDVQAITQYSRQFSNPINMIANIYTQILTAMAGAERVFEILDEPDEIDEGKTNVELSDITGNIDFNHINFSYNGEVPVLRDFSLSVKPGQKIALVGATGSGKTTAINLLTRFYDVDSGEILLDGININDIPKESLRHAIAIVLQDTVLFSDSVTANIKYGRLDAGDEEVREAARAACCTSFIERLPRGYDTVLSGGGGNLSQGQRQLLTIARAILANPKILILDEATSNVDTRTEVKIQKAMAALMKGRTSIIIAHRLSTIQDADKIIVIKNGAVAQCGSHSELLSEDGEYKRLYQSQFAGFET